MILNCVTIASAQSDCQHALQVISFFPGCQGDYQETGKFDFNACWLFHELATLCTSTISTLNYLMELIGHDIHVSCKWGWLWNPLIGFKYIHTVERRDWKISVTWTKKQRLEELTVLPAFVERKELLTFWIKSLHQYGTSGVESGYQLALN